MVLARRRSASTILCTALALQCVHGAEKGQIARIADAVVVGQLKAAWSFPWFDGWHVRGVLRIDKTLWGTAKQGDTVSFRFVCRDCPFWPRPNIKQLENVTGVWFGVKNGSGAWEPAGVQAGDPGYRPIADLPYFERVLSARRLNPR